jgi:peptidoglycan L-alanyl-D-glutamate endopeptidase CwlK
MGGMLRGIGQSMGLKIRWGGDWDSDGDINDNKFDDLVHVEIKD